MTQAVYAHRIWIITESKLLSIGFTMVRKSEETPFKCSFAIVVNYSGSHCFIYIVRGRNYILHCHLCKFLSYVGILRAN